MFFFALLNIFVLADFLLDEFQALLLCQLFGWTFGLLLLFRWLACNHQYFLFPYLSAGTCLQFYFKCYLCRPFSVVFGFIFRYFYIGLIWRNQLFSIHQSLWNFNIFKHDILLCFWWCFGILLQQSIQVIGGPSLHHIRLLWHWFSLMIIIFRPDEWIILFIC